MKKVIKLTESDLKRIIKKVIKEQQTIMGDNSLEKCLKDKIESMGKDIQDTSVCISALKNFPQDMISMMKCANQIGLNVDNAKQTFKEILVCVDKNTNQPMSHNESNLDEDEDLPA